MAQTILDDGINVMGGIVPGPIQQRIEERQTTLPVITYPADGDTVPLVHDIRGTAAGLQTVHLLSANNDKELVEHATVKANAAGEFAFTGDQPSGHDGDTAHFQVTTTSGESAVVTVTVTEGASG